MSEENSVCACGEAPTLNFSCSGGSDVGEISDRAARKLIVHEGIGNFSHLRITGLGMGKGKSPAAAERISVMAEQGNALLAR